MSQLKQAEYHLRKVRSHFHGSLPHNFIDPDLPIEMEATLHQIQQQLETTHQECDKNAQRIRYLQQYFD
jgi:MoxR-like ATPase